MKKRDVGDPLAEPKQSENEAPKGKKADIPPLDPKKAEQIKRIQIYVTQGIIYLFVFSVVPLLIHGNGGMTAASLYLCLYTLNMLASLILPAISCARHGFKFIDPLLPALLFLPAPIFIYRFPIFAQYSIYYLIAALAGASIGHFIYRRRKNKQKFQPPRRLR